MTGRVSRRHRWVAAVAMAFGATGVTVAQVTSAGVPPPLEAIAIPLPPLVVTPPAAPPPVKREVAPLPSVRVDVVPIREKPETPAAITVPVIVPTIEVPTKPAQDVAKPAVPATTVSMARPTKPAMAEIIAAGPKAVDASAAFTAAMKDAKAANGKVRDYSGHLLLQERLKGQLQAEQTAELRVRTQPNSVAVKFIAPSVMVGRELIFVDGRNANKVRSKAAGTYGPLAFANVMMSEPKAAVSTRLTLADVGIGPMLDRVERALATEAKLRNPVSVTAADFKFAGKTVTRYELCFDRPHALRDAARIVLCIDPDTKLPVRLELYDALSTGKLEGELRDAISFVNLAFNQGISDGPFEK